MRQIHFTILILATLSSCTSGNDNNAGEQLVERYIEKESPITDLFFFRIRDNQWIRQPENIMTVHETFKKGFYQTYLTSDILDQNSFVNGDIYYNTTLRTIIDSLIKTYPEYNSADKYYKEFWLRRKSEQNDSTVLLVLTEIQAIINGDSIMSREEYVNEKFRKMVQIVTDWQKGLNDRMALSHFDFLQTEKMHQSAYNLLYQNFFYDEIKLNRDSLETTLEKEKVLPDNVTQRDVFIIDNTK